LTRRREIETAAGRPRFGYTCARIRNHRKGKPMNHGKLLLASPIGLASAAAHADVTVTTQTSGKASFINVGGEGLNYIKGKRQRTDSMVGGRTVALIIDIDNLRFVDLDD